MRVPGFLSPKCFYCRRRIPDASVQGWAQTVYGWKRVCRGCSVGSPDLPNRIAEREKRERQREQRQRSIRERQRRQKPPKQRKPEPARGGWKYKKGEKHRENPNQQPLF